MAITEERGNGPYWRTGTVYENIQSYVCSALDSRYCGIFPVAGSKAGVLALSDDSHFLYAGLDGRSRVQRLRCRTWSQT
jgi:hypothetical protein